MVDLNNPNYTIPPILTPIRPGGEVAETEDRSTLGTAFRLENPVQAYWASATKPTFDNDPNFTTARHTKLLTDPAFRVPPRYTDALSRVRSEDEFHYTYGQIQKEMGDRQFLESQGAAGVAAEILAGFVTPTVFIPFLGQGSFAARVGFGAVTGLAGEALDEAALHQSQYGRSMEGTVIGLGVATVLGGLAGAFTSGVSKQQADKIVRDITGESGETTLTALAGRSVYAPPLAAAVGAEAVAREPVRAAGALGLQAVPGVGNLNPVNRALFQNVTDTEGLATANWFQREFSTGGLLLEDAGRLGLNPEGTVEARVRLYNANAYNAIRGLHVNSTALRKSGVKLSTDDYYTEVTRALANNDQHANPIIAKAASDYRRALYEPIGEEAKRAGLFDPEIEDLLIADPSYAMRDWDTQKLLASPDIVDRFAADFAKQLTKRAMSRFAKHEEKVRRLLTEGAENAAEQIRKLSDQITRELEDLGGASIDVAQRRVDFDAHARQAAQDTFEKMTTAGHVSPTMAVLQAPNGRTLARVLDVRTSDYLDVINTDLESGALKYARGLGADIELKSRFGDVDGSLVKSQMRDELTAKLRRIGDLAISDAAKAKARTRLNEQFTTFSNDIDVQIARMRGTYGIPRDPGSGVRMGRGFRHLTSAALLGGAGLASIPELALGIMTHGLTRTFRYALTPYFSGLKVARAQIREARAAAIGINGVLHTRSQRLIDDTTAYQAMGKWERATEGLSRYNLRFSLLDLVTDLAQNLNAHVAINSMFADMDTIVNRPAARGAKKAQQRLTQMGINDSLARRLMGEMNGVEQGGGKIGGTWLPNTENWNVANARAFRAALNRVGETTTIQAGVEVPNWVGSNEITKILAQFTTTMFSMNNKVMLRAAQLRDANAIMGIASMMMLSSLKDYFEATALGKGEEYRERTMPQHVTNAIAGSGLLGIYSDATGLFTADSPEYMIQSRLSPPVTALAEGAVIPLKFLRGDDVTADDAFDAAQVAPFNNLPPLSWILEEMEDD